MLDFCSISFTGSLPTSCTIKIAKTFKVHKLDYFKKF